MRSDAGEPGRLPDQSTRRRSNRVLAVSFWDDHDAIVVFAGEDIDQAVFYPEDDRYLIARETTVLHYTVH